MLYWLFYCDKKSPFDNCSINVFFMLAFSSHDNIEKLYKIIYNLTEYM